MCVPLTLFLLFLKVTGGGCFTIWCHVCRALLYPHCEWCIGLVCMFDLIVWTLVVHACMTLCVCVCVCVCVCSLFTIQVVCDSSAVYRLFGRNSFIICLVSFFSSLLFSSWPAPRCPLPWCTFNYVQRCVCVCVYEVMHFLMTFSRMLGTVASNYQHLSSSFSSCSFSSHSHLSELPLVVAYYVHIWLT